MAMTNQYTDDDFLNALRGGKPIPTSLIRKTVGCCRDTTVARLKRLEKQGKIKRINMMSRELFWKKVM